MRYLIVLILIAVSICSQYIPIPRQKHGLNFGNNNASLHIQAFYDLLCSDSKDADDTLNNVIAKIGTDKFKLTYIFVPLPYHLYAFKVHQLYQYILQNFGQKYALAYIGFILKNQQSYMESKWRNYKITQFETTLATNVAKTFKLNATDLWKALQPGSSSDIKTRSEWKYATGTLGVSGTPIFYANGVRIDGAQEWTQAQWINFISENS